MTAEQELRAALQALSSAAVKHIRACTSDSDSDEAPLASALEVSLDVLRRTESELVHWCDQGQQPDIHVECSDTWSTPAWGVDSEGREKSMVWSLSGEPAKGVYRLDSGHLYTFEGWRVTCPECLRIRPQKTLEQEFVEMSASWGGDMHQLALAKIALSAVEQTFDRLSYKLGLLTSTLQECTQSSGELASAVDGVVKELKEKA